MTEALSYFFMSWTDPYLLFLTAAGTFAGIYIGAIPGLSVTMAVSILISFTFKWHVNEALALIAGIFLGGVYGGSRSAILLNIPGAPAAIATALDGYPLAKRGEAGTAIGLTTVVSVLGGFIGIIALAVGGAGAVQALAAVRAARLPAARDLGHPAGRQPVRRVAGQGHLRRRAGRADRHGRPRPADGGRPLHLRIRRN